MPWRRHARGHRHALLALIKLDADFWQHRRKRRGANGDEVSDSVVKDLLDGRRRRWESLSVAVGLIVTSFWKASAGNLIVPPNGVAFAFTAFIVCLSELLSAMSTTLQKALLVSNLWSKFVIEFVIDLWSEFAVEFWIWICDQNCGRIWSIGIWNQNLWSKFTIEFMIRSIVFELWSNRICDRNLLSNLRSLTE